MPTDLDNKVIVKSAGTKTRFTSQPIDNPLDCHKYFGKYAEGGSTILICEPERGCAPYVVIPDGTIACVFTSGAFDSYAQPGIMFCTPFTEVKYLVSKQDFVYESPNNMVITQDNVSVTISVSILLKINEESDYVQQFVTNVAQQNELIDANISERVRTMARTVKSREAYNLRGELHAESMKEYLNTNLQNKGIIVKRVMITNVVLNKDIADAMQETTIYQFKTTLERKRFAYDQRLTNDKEEESKSRQIHEEERKDEAEQAQLKQMEKQKEIEGIKAKIQRTKSEWKANTDALINQINAETELNYNEIIAEARLIETQIVEQAQAEAAEIVAKADAYEATEISKAQEEVAPMVARAVTLEGEAEQKMLKGFAQKRVHEQLMHKMDAVKSFSKNKHSVIFGTQQNNLLAQVETYNMVQKK